MIPARTRGVVLFTAAYILAAALAALLSGNQEFLLYIVIVSAVFVAIAAIHRQVPLSQGALWCVSVWGLMHMAGGLVPVPESWPIEGDISVLYSLWLIPGALKYDNVAHAYCFGVAAWVCWQWIRAVVPVGRPTVGWLIIAGAAGLGFGALNEVIEFVATRTMENTNVGGYVNTGWDLVANLVGVVIAMVAVWRWDR
jgi:uncharacterized membrane protein YjdF